MRTIRIYEGQDNLKIENEILLSEMGSAHILRVLRMKKGDPINIFDGKGHEFETIITDDKKQAKVKIIKEIENNRESPIKIELGQVISRGDKMDYTIQKACELGIFTITPLVSIRCNVKLDNKREDKKILSWQKIAASACEQCYRSFVPTINPIETLNSWCKKDPDAINITLDPYARSSIKDLHIDKSKKIRLLIGPEGGFDNSEIELTKACNFQGVTLGPRILRTETAALVALSILGSHFGDL